MNNPLVLASYATLKPGDRKSLVNERALMNPLHGAMFVDEIRFAIVTTVPDDSYDAYVRAIVRVGNEALTHGDSGVAIGLLGQIRDRYMAGCGTNGEAVQLKFQQEGALTTFFRWRFRKPLYVNYDEPIHFELALDSAVGVAYVAAPLTVFVTAMCRTVPDNVVRPKTRSIPFAAQWPLGLISSTQAPLLFKSDKNLVNPFDVPLRLSGFPWVMPSSADDPDSLTTWERITIRMTRGDGSIVIRDWLPIAMALQTIEERWCQNAILSPKETFNLQVNVAANWYNVGTIYPIIGMTGDREVSNG